MCIRDSYHRTRCVSTVVSDYRSSPIDTTIVRIKNERPTKCDLDVFHFCTIFVDICEPSVFLRMCMFRRAHEIPRHPSRFFQLVIFRTNERFPYQTSRYQVWNTFWVCSGWVGWVGLWVVFLVRLAGFNWFLWKLLFWRLPQRMFEKCVSVCTQKAPNLLCCFLERRLTNTPRRHRLADGQLSSLCDVEYIE